MLMLGKSFLMSMESEQREQPLDWLCGKMSRASGWF